MVPGCRWPRCRTTAGGVGLDRLLIAGDNDRQDDDDDDGDRQRQGGAAAPARISTRMISSVA